jgi:hypothetical protein
MDYDITDDGRVRLTVTDRELLGLKGALLEASEAIRDDMAFSARLGVTRDEADVLFDAVVAARRLLADR